MNTSVVDVDDTNPAIVYNGTWQVLDNNPLEFGGGVHSTTQTGASATITFIGTRIQMFCTVPMGTGNETADFTFDGFTGPSLTRNSHATISYYKDGWFDSGPVSDSEHVLTVSNGGGPSETPFQIDYFAVNGSVVSPSGTAATSSSPQATSTGSAVPTGKSSASNSSGHGSGSKTPIGAIVGGVLGGLFFLVFLVLLLFLYRRYRRRRIGPANEAQRKTDSNSHPRDMTAVMPFQLDTHQLPTSPTGDSASRSVPNNSNIRNEKISQNSSTTSPANDSLVSTSPSAPLSPEMDAGSYRPSHLSGMPPSYQA